MINKRSLESLLHNPQLPLDFSGMLWTSETVLQLRSLHLITVELYSSAIIPATQMRAGKYVNSGS